MELPERDWDETDVSGEVEEARHEAFLRQCMKRDMDQGIEPFYSDDDNE
jgi:hypothetical protein